jgi:hypothetical protein
MGHSGQGLRQAGLADTCGIDIDLEEAAKHPFEQESIAAREAIHEVDGAIAHW